MLKYYYSQVRRSCGSTKLWWPGCARSATDGAAEYLVVETEGEVMPLAAAEIEVGGNMDSEELVDVSVIG